MKTKNIWLLVCMILMLATGSVSATAPPGFVKTTIPLNAPPVGLAFDSSGVLYALEGASFGSNVATMRTILPNGSYGTSFSVVGDDSSNFFAGGMAYDPIGDRLLVTDNTADGRVYAVEKTGAKQTLSRGLAGAAGVAVRDSGEIFVTTSPFGSPGDVFQVDRMSGAATSVLAGLGYGAGLAFDLSDNLIVQDADTATFQGRLQKLPISGPLGALTFGTPVPLLSGMQSSAGVIVDSEGDMFTTGSGGLFLVSGSPLAETSFDTNGSPSQFATAIAFDAGSRPFERFLGPDGGRLAYMADFGFASQDSFVTLLTPAGPGDYNGDGHVDTNDFGVWRSTFDSTTDPSADGNLDGVVDSRDFVIWRKNIGTAGAGSAARGLAIVPEPALLTLVMTGLVALGFVTHRRPTWAAERARYRATWKAQSLVSNSTLVEG
jgi:hypothetical protein